MNQLLRYTLTATILASVMRMPAQTQLTTDTVRFHQDRFAIGFWVDPPADEKMDQRYREIADANFTIVIGGYGAERARKIQQQLDLCQQLGLKALVSVPGKDLAKLAPDHPALWGYSWYDEPGTGQFQQLTSDVVHIRQARPGKLTFINLLPDYAPAKALGTTSYTEYVRRFIDEVKPDVLSMDYYPQFLPDRKHDGRAGYLGNLEVMRAESLRAGIPYWNFFNTMPYGPHTDPTEAQLRWQIYATLAYGAKGVLYFCYYTPGGNEFPKGGAIIDRQDRKTRHYDQARRINAELKNLGPTLMQLTSTRVTHVQRPEKGQTTDWHTSETGAVVRKVSGWPSVDCLLGEFRHTDGRRAVLLANYDFAYTSWPTVEFDTPAETVKEVDKVTGKEVPLVDDSPNIPGIQLSLDAGDGRLFLLPSAGN
jgi:hypothetical protein